MDLNLLVIARSAVLEGEWAEKLRNMLGGMGVRVGISSESARFEKDRRVTEQDVAETLVLVDGSIDHLEGKIDKVRAEMSKSKVFLVMPEQDALPRLLLDGKVDDVLVAPFRQLEVLSKLRFVRQLLMWDEVTKMNTSFSELLERMKDDVELVERIQKSRMPGRFTDIKGFKVASRYLVGNRPGGDHFDLADAKDEGILSLLLSDSSSYGLSSAVLSILMRVAVKLSAREAHSSAEMVRRIQDELMMPLSPKDSLSLFYGVISRKTLQMRYLNLGSSCAFYNSKGGKAIALPSQGGSITQKSDKISESEGGIKLEPGGRLVLLSDGFVETVGGVPQSQEFLDKFHAKDAASLVNELAFFVKSSLSDPEGFPAQDCTAVVLDLDHNLIRLA